MNDEKFIDIAIEIIKGLHREKAIEVLKKATGE